MNLRISFVLALALAVSRESSPQSNQALRTARTLWATDAAEVPRMAQEVETRLRSGQLVSSRTQRDGQLAGRIHERLDQYHEGIRVFGGQLVWQKEGERVLSVTGKLYDGIDVPTRAGLTEDEAAARGLEGSKSARVVGRLELVVLPLAERYALAYYLHVRGPDRLEAIFVDASSGAILLRYDDRRSQSVVGLGVGTWSDEKKMSVEAASGTHRAVDDLRPFGIRTYDVGFDFEAWFFYASATDDYLASDFDNEWSDGAVVDAHAYSGYTYDYFFKVHGRRGVDDTGLAAISFVHFLPQSEAYNNAYFDNVDISINYGDGDGETFTYFSSGLDVVAHELTHAVTYFSSDLIYLNESGALNEAFSDVMAAGVEWYFEPPGEGRQRADWKLAEDVFLRFGSFLRSYENPAAAGDPDHYSVRCLCSVDEDNGGVHINSSIVNQAYYLMVQGGTNRTSGISVRGIGTAQRERIEKIFYRAFVFYLVPSSTFRDAREATLRAAAELYGAGSVEQETVRQGWDAVGMP